MNFSPKLTFFVLRNFFGRKNFDPKLRRRRIGPLKKKLNNNFLFNYQENTNNFYIILNGETIIVGPK